MEGINGITQKRVVFTNRLSPLDKTINKLLEIQEGYAGLGDDIARSPSPASLALNLHLFHRDVKLAVGGLLMSKVK